VVAFHYLGYAFAIIIAYIAGSLPFAYLAGKIVGGKDLRLIGSGNLGTSNVFHEVGKVAGVFVFFLDCAKMAFTILFFRLLSLPMLVQSLGALAVIAGHNWSIFTGFKGGRGMAVTLVGALIILPWETIVILGILLYGVLTRTLAMYCGFSLLVWPVMAILRGEPWQWILFSLGIALLGFARRLQGSPDVACVPGEFVPRRDLIKSRLVLDREYVSHRE